MRSDPLWMYASTHVQTTLRPSGLRVVFFNPTPLPLIFLIPAAGPAGMIDAFLLCLRPCRSCYCDHSCTPYRLCLLRFLGLLGLSVGFGSGAGDQAAPIGIAIGSSFPASKEFDSSISCCRLQPRLPKLGCCWHYHVTNSDAMRTLTPTHWNCR